MKKILTLAFVLIFAFNNYAQITIADYSGLNLTNTSAFLPTDLAYFFEITNEASSDKNFIMQVTVYTLPEGDTKFEVCAFGLCVSPINTQITPIQIGSSTSISAGDTYGEEGNTNSEFADIIYTSAGSTGHASITIKIFEEGNESNSAEFSLDTDYLSVNRTKSNNNISVYPNPATNHFNIQVSPELIGSQVVFTNLLGKAVYKTGINRSIQTIQTNQFAKGVYFYSVINNNRIIETKKLIIK